MNLQDVVSGVDEAGRGSVFGPLIIVGLSIRKEDIDYLREIGVKDSKLFTNLEGRKKRNELASEIKRIAKQCNIVEISAVEIDKTLTRRPQDNLNLLELRYFYYIIKELKSNKIYLDSLSKPKYTMDQIRRLIQINRDKFFFKVKSIEENKCEFSLGTNKVESKHIVVSTKADGRYTVVAAASCVAKSVRDQKLRTIEKDFDLPELSLGQGYPNEKDNKVMTFLAKYRREIRDQLFPFIRYKWEWKVLQQITSYPEKELDHYF